MAVLNGIRGAGTIGEVTFGGGKFDPLPAGGYVCKILDVKVDETKGGKTFINLRIDVSEGKHAGFFKRRFDADAGSRYGQKWKGTFRIFLPVFTGDNDAYVRSVGVYKGQINTIARANNLPELNIEAGYDPDIFKSCTIGILFRDAEYKGNKFTEAAFLIAPDKIRNGDFEIPEPRSTRQATTNAFAAPATGGGVFAAAAVAPKPGDLSDFVDVQTNTDDIPF